MKATAVLSKYSGIELLRIARAGAVSFCAPRNLWLLVRCCWEVGLRRKQLVVLERRGGLGDLICLLASVAGLRRRHPDAWLVLIAPLGCWPIAASSGLVDAAADALGVFHLFLQAVCPAERYYRPLLPDESSPPAPQLRHLTEEFAGALGVAADFSGVSVAAPPRVRRHIARWLRKVNPGSRPIVVLHPGPAWPVREWPAASWRELAILAGARLPACLIKIGMSRDSMWRRRPTPALPGVVECSDRMRPIELVALLEQASAFVGIDSGPLHVAAALGVPSVALFGPTSGALRLHPRAQATILSGAVGCLGCHHEPTGPLHWRTGCPHNIACMRQVGAAEVCARLIATLEEKAPAPV